MKTSVCLSMLFLMSAFAGCQQKKDDAESVGTDETAAVDAKTLEAGPKRSPGDLLNSMKELKNLAMAAQGYALVNGLFPYAGEVIVQSLDTDPDSHQVKMMKKRLPGWVETLAPFLGDAQGKNLDATFVMNGRFGFSRSGIPCAIVGMHRDYFPRQDRTLMFAECPACTVAAIGQKPVRPGEEGLKTKGVLDYRAGDVIGFNYCDEQGIPLAVVVFADGHVEQLKAPATAENVKQLTTWLCKGADIRYDETSGCYQECD